ncbi:IclR family transcriptional regulator [Variovorax sp. VNK109]|uniref:IclR family transcriptional regulator n=1 Tax=Variovorax sp. VNK109 TaxID=3400919 RepID=UPI003C0A11BE
MSPAPSQAKDPTPESAATVQSAPRSVTRVLGLFGRLANYPKGATLAELSIILESPKSSLLLLLRPLVMEAYLLHENGRYRLGPAIYRLAATITGARNLNSLIRPYIAELAQAVSESVYLAVLDPGMGVCTYIEGVDSQQAVRFVLPLGQPRALYGTSAGRLLLAWQDKQWIEQYLQRTKLIAATKNSIVSKDKLRKELSRIRVQGYALTVNEGHEGATGVAAPILDSSGGIWAALVVALPTHRFDSSKEHVIQTLQAISMRASGELQAVDGA